MIFVLINSCVEGTLIFDSEMNVVVNSMDTSDHRGKILVHCQVCL